MELELILELGIPGAISLNENPLEKSRVWSLESGCLHEFGCTTSLFQLYEMCFGRVVGDVIAGRLLLELGSSFFELVISDHRLQETVHSQSISPPLAVFFIWRLDLRWVNGLTRAFFFARVRTMHVPYYIIHICFR